MSSPTTITIDKLYRLIGTPGCPALIDVRTDEDFAADPRLVPGSMRREHDRVQNWAPALGKASATVICHRGKKLSEGVAAWLRHLGVAAESLEGGYEAWIAADYPAVPVAALRGSNTAGNTLWVTRARPKIDRIACPWLIRRFVDPGAIFLFVAPQEVAGVAERFGAIPFDVEDVFWSHRGELCTFDVMVSEFGLSTKPLLKLARIVRGADTARLDLEPEASGLLAVSLGLSRMYSNDLAQLDAGMTLYDAFYRWCRDATDETHNWPSAKSGAVP
ncbi:sulfurtransferase/chromate resistance protein [Mesorhizobium sp. YM1C-6-2]|uniref:chromate resistance protein ChrB domain-containing protein n=1 Tax=Mesorhizobium sp. YM1C-6-2 TaxID=1827501 RepID=UPI000EF1CABF|nr:sulfurtransferase/chromate resistance protein [Mesorhizobium sp. YM1C-6-2]RLP24394.1 sulfurtransferase [Mesorhizobium sp. YM1C-6-2]